MESNIKTKGLTDHQNSSKETALHAWKDARFLSTWKHMMRSTGEVISLYERKPDK
jgi:hypothetical protein